VKKLNLVLLVDDDEISNFVTEKHIDRSNLVDHLEIKTNGQEAAEYLSNCKNTYPDLVLLDINMPLMSGFELLDHYQQSSYSGKTKFAILTTSTHQMDKDTALKFKDVIGYIEKPLNVKKLEVILRKL
jgi:CheY-like chemotaxis protein